MANHNGETEGCAQVKGAAEAQAPGLQGALSTSLLWGLRLTSPEPDLLLFLQPEGGRFSLSETVLDSDLIQS